MLDDFDIEPRTRGRAGLPLIAEVVRELGPADFALLASERGIKPPPLVRLNDRHHSLARCLAKGMAPAEASAVTGYDPSRISILQRDPAFKELVEHYRKVENALFAEFTERATNLSLTAMNKLQELLEDDDAPVSVGTALEIAKFAADRTGHAPVNKSMNVNINADLGARMEAAKRRLDNAG